MATDEWSRLLGCTASGALAVVLLGILLLLWTQVLIIQIKGSSMTPSLAPGDRVLVLRCWPRHWLRRGQIVLVWPWLSAAAGPRAWNMLQIEPFIKRIVGVPPDVLVTTLNEIDDYHQAQEQAAHDASGRRRWVVPPGHVFVRGDAHPGGFDSLVWGPIPAHTVLGVVLFRLPVRPRSVAHQGHLRRSRRTPPSEVA